MEEMKNNGKTLRQALFCLALGLFLWAQAGAAFAATWTVTNTSDSGAGSLRDAISSAASGDTIQFGAGLAGQTITLASEIDAGANNLNFRTAGGGRVTLAGADLKSTGKLSFDVTNTDIEFRNTLAFTNGINAARHISVTLADYTGGRAVLDAGASFAGRVSIQGMRADGIGGLSGAGGGIRTVQREETRLAYLDAELVEIVTGLGATVSLSGGKISGNTASASGSPGSHGYGGGIYATDTLSITADSTDRTEFLNNRATTKGGGIFMDTSGLLGEMTYDSDPSRTLLEEHRRPLVLNIITGGGDIIFSGNRHAVADASTPYDASDGAPNAVYFGVNGGMSEADAVLNISGTGLLKMEDPIEVNMNNGKSFTMIKDGSSYLNWGGVNLLDAAGGSTVTLGSGTQFYSDFSLDNPKANSSANIILNLNGNGNYYQVARQTDSGLPSESFSFSNTTLNLSNNVRLVPYGTLILGDNSLLNIASGSGIDLENGAILRTSGNSRINGGTLAFNTGNTLKVDLGKTLALGSTTNLAFNGGTLSIGVGASNASGLIDMTANTTTAPTFNGSNTLDISEWIAGGYTVLEAGKSMAYGALDTFQTFTVGGNALGAGMSITPSYFNEGTEILVTASLGRDNAELTWGGAATGAWNYTNTNWTLSASPTNFLPGDAALFDSTGAASQTVALGGTSIDLSGLHVTGGADYTLSGAALRIDSSGAQGTAIAGLSYKDKLVKDGFGSLTLNTGSIANPNLINTVEINNGTLTLGNGFALAPVSGRGSLMGNGGTLALAGTAYLTNIDAYLVNAFSLSSGNTLVLADSSLDRNTVGLNVGSGATLASAGAGNTLSGSALNLNGGTLDMRGNSVFTLNAPLAGTGGTTRFNSGDSQIRLQNGGNLGAGVLDVDLNRSKTLAAVDVTGGSLALADSTLRLRYTGSGVADGSWLIINGAYTDYNGASGSGESFRTLDIATATLQGVLRNDPAQIWFDGTYTPLTPGGITGLGSLSPNARNMASGLLERIEYGRGPAYEYLYSLSGDSFNNTVLGVLPYASAEGAVSQGIQALTAHNAAAMAAFGYAFGPDALESAQSFAPLAFQAPNTLGFNMGSQSRRDQARATARQTNRLASLDGDVGYGHSSYSILGNWTPALDSTRNLVASASPEFTLNAVGANTPFGARIWGGYLGNFAHQDNKGGYAGYDADQNGFLLGGSFDLGANWTVGTYAGWTTGSTRYNDIKTRIDTDATHVGAFARYKRELGPGTAKVTGDVLYSFTDNDSRRTVPLGGPLGDQRMKGSFDQNIIGGGLEAAYDWKPGFDEALVLTPYLAGRYAHLEQDGFTESGNLGLKVGKTDADSFTTTVGVKAARDFSVSDTVILTPKATVGWLHQWADRDVSANSSFIGSPVTFMTRSVKQDADAALVGVGLDVLVKTGKSWDLGLKLGYGADIRQNSNDQTVFAGFEIKF